MVDKPRRCMVCGKPTDENSGICRACHESIRGEASGKQKKIAQDADKEIRRQGILSSDRTPNKHK